ncbi:MAG: hypothetical protein ACW99R_10520 [Candidatus Hodarchaeales archaeon]|jgi:hypothetical protein
MSEVQKELEKAQAFESAGNFEKAAKTYLQVAKSIPDGQRSLKLYNKAFFSSQKTGKNSMMFDYAKQYYQQLLHEEQQKAIKELLPTFLDLSGRMRDTIDDLKPEDKLKVLSWALELYQLADNQTVAYEISQDIGDTYFNFGKQFLAPGHLLGKEEKYNKGVNLFNKAIENYQMVVLDKSVMDKILEVKLEKINRFIDINRPAEAMEDTANLMRFFKSQNADVLPYPQKELSLRIAQILALKALEKVQKQIDIARVLQKTASAGFLEADDPKRVAPFLWSLAQIYDKANHLEDFNSTITDAFDAAVTHDNQEIIENILTYLFEQGTTISDNVINSRMLLVKKGSIEFQNNKGIHYLLQRINLSKSNYNEIVDQTTEYLFNYGQLMFTKKLRIQALPYFEYCAQIWWDLYQESGKAREITTFLQSNFGDLLSEGKLDDAATQLISIVDLFTYFGDIEMAGDTAFSFAQTLGQEGKISYEYDFLERAQGNFETLQATEKLQSLIDYLIERSDPFFSQDTSMRDDLQKFLYLISKTGAAISKEKHGEVLAATTYKSINSNLMELASGYAEQTFTVYSSYNEELAADFYFKIGSLLLEKNPKVAVELISKSTQLAANETELEQIVLRNLQYLMDQTLSASLLSAKLFIINQLETIASLVHKRAIFNAFLFPFVQNLAESAVEPEYFTEINNFLLKTFTVYFEENKSHPHLEEIVEWTNNFILKLDDTLHLTEMILLSLNFHEKINKPDQFISFIWPIMEKLSSEKEDYQKAITIYGQTFSFLKRLDAENEEFTEKVVALLDRDQKSRIHDEQFEEAWAILQALFQILSEADMKKQAMRLYKDNAILFAPLRLDLALTMWNQAGEVANSLENSTELITSICSEIREHGLTVYKEEQNQPAVIQLFNQIIELNSVIDNVEEVIDYSIERAKFLLMMGDFASLLEWGEKSLQLSIEKKLEDLLVEITNLFYSAGRSLLEEDPETAIALINTASNNLKAFGEKGTSRYSTKIAEIYEELYRSPVGNQLAISERENLLKHFKDNNLKQEEAKFLLTSAKIAFTEGNTTDTIEQLFKSTDMFQELEDNDGLSEIVTFCLKTASKFPVGSSEYNALSQHAATIQNEGITLSDEQSQEAFGDLFDGILDDMTSLFDPKEKKKRMKEKKK